MPRSHASSCPRYAPEIPFPEYRFIPGETPHPYTHPDGHSYGRERGFEGPPLTADNWATNQVYLVGVDLYNHAYWWEAHEWWEALWHRAERGRSTSLFLQGLIQISAGFIKWHQGNPRGVDRLHENGCRKLVQISRRHPEPYMGLPLDEFLARLTRFTRTFPIFVPGACADPSSAPLIRLTGI